MGVVFMLKDRLIDLRKANNDTQDCLAKKLSVSRSLIAKWEQGRAIPDATYLNRIFAIYNVSPQERVELERLLLNKENYYFKYLFSIGFGELIFLSSLTLLYVIFDKVCNIGPTTILCCAAFLIFLPIINFIVLKNGKKYKNYINFNEKVLILITVTFLCCLCHFIFDLVINLLFYGPNSLSEDMSWKMLYFIIETLFLLVVNITSFKLLQCKEKPSKIR